MSSTSTPTTFSDLFTDAGNRLRVNVTDSTTLAILKRYINQGLHDVHIQQNWPWAERETALVTHAPYSTGTVDITAAARTTVTGNSTLWNTTVTGMGFTNARIRGKMTFQGSPIVHTVQTVTSDVSITLYTRWVGDALSGATYSYFEDEYTLASAFWRMSDVRLFSTNMGIPIISRQDFYRQYTRNSTIGRPRVCTLVDYGPRGTTDSEPRVVFHPAPDAVYNIPYRYITRNLSVTSAGVAATNLVDDTDEPIIPIRYRHCLIFYAIAQWYRDRKDDVRSQEANGEYVDLIRRMAGDVSPERNHPRMRHNRRDYMRGVGGYGRFSIGTAFDEIADRGTW